MSFKSFWEWWYADFVLPDIVVDNIVRRLSTKDTGVPFNLYSCTAVFRSVSEHYPRNLAKFLVADYGRFSNANLINSGFKDIPLGEWVSMTLEQNQEERIKRVKAWADSLSQPRVKWPWQAGKRAGVTYTPGPKNNGPMGRLPSRGYR